MNNKKKLRKIRNMTDLTTMLLICAISVVITSCAGESSIYNCSGKATTVSIKMQVPSQTNVSTRATTLSGNESTVNNLTALIFNSSNQLIGYGYSASPTSTGTNTYQMTVSTRVATSCTVYVVANAGANAFAGVNTVDEFKKQSVALSAASDLGAQSSTIMQGVSATSQDITSSTETLATTIPLYRLCTKINFNIIPASNITITGYQLHEVPASSYIADRSAETTPAYNPSGSYKDFAAITESSPTAGNEVTDTYYIYENLAGTVAASNTAKTRNSKNAPATASYLDVYATGSNWQSTYRIYLGGTGTTDYTNYNIPRNYNYTYTINITGSGIYDVRVTCYPELINSSTAGTWGSNGSATAVTSSATANVGDYYFSDGTWGSLDNNPGKTPIAVVFSGTTSTTDQGHGWTHGYAMALTNASTSSAWGIDGTDETVLNDYQGEYDTFITNKDGYTETMAIKNAYNSTLQSAHPAFYYALNYGVTAPSSSSGWYLPSVGQWWDIETKLGDISTIPESSPGNCYWYNSNNSTHYSTISVKNINKYLTSIDNYITPDYFDDNTNYYWSSSEYNSNNSYHSSFQIGGADMDLNNGPKNCFILVRSAIAF